MLYLLPIYLLEAGRTDDEQVLWWSKGGAMRGESPARIRWFRQYVAGAPQPLPAPPLTLALTLTLAITWP